MVLGIFAMALPVVLGHMQGTNGASHGVGRLLGVHEGGVHHIGGDTSREQLGHRRGDIQFHRVVEVAAAMASVTTGNS